MKSQDSDPTPQADADLQRMKMVHSFLTEVAKRFNQALPQELMEFAKDPFTPLNSIWNDGWEAFWQEWYFLGFQPYWAQEDMGTIEGVNPRASIAMNGLAHVLAEPLGQFELAVLQSIAESPFTFWQIVEVETPNRLVVRSIYFDETITLHENVEQLSTEDILFARIVTHEETSFIAGCAPVLFNPQNLKAIESIRLQLLALANHCDDPSSALTVLSKRDYREYDFFLMDLFSELTSYMLQPRFSVDPDSMLPKLHHYEFTLSSIEALHRLDDLRDKEVAIEEDKQGVKDLLLRTEQGYPIPVKMLDSQLQVLTLSDEIEEWVKRELEREFGDTITLKNSRKLEEHEFQLTTAKKENAANS